MQICQLILCGGFPLSSLLALHSDLPNSFLNSVISLTNCKFWKKIHKWKHFVPSKLNCILKNKLISFQRVGIWFTALYRSGTLINFAKPESLDQSIVQIKINGAKIKTGGQITVYQAGPPGAAYVNMYVQGKIIRIVTYSAFFLKACLSLPLI